MLTGYVYNKSKKIKWCITRGEIYFCLNDISKYLGRYSIGLSQSIKGLNRCKIVYRGNEGTYLNENQLLRVKKFLENKDHYEYNLFVNEVMPLVKKIKEQELIMNNFKKYTFQDVNDVTQTINYLCSGDKIWFDLPNFLNIVGFKGDVTDVTTKGVFVRKTKRSTLINKQSITQMDQLIIEGKLSANQWDNKDAILHLLGNACETKKSGEVVKPKPELEPYYIVERDIPTLKVKHFENKGYKYARVSLPPFGSVPVVYNKQGKVTIRGTQKMLEKRFNCKDKIEEIEKWVLNQFNNKNDISNKDVIYISESIGCTPFKFYQSIQEKGYTKNKDKVWTLKQEKPDPAPMFLPEPQPETKTIRYKELVSSKGWWLFKNEVWEVKSIEVLASEVEAFKDTIENHCEIIEII